MTGQHLQNLMKQEGYSVNEMAKMIGKAQQVLASALKHDDVRTGLVEDIARAMGMTESAVKVTLHRTREKFRKHLDKEGITV